MRILYHHRTMAEDAQGIHIHEMVRAFRKAGHEVEVFALVREGGREQKGEVSRLGRLKERIPGFAYELAEMGYTLYGAARLLRAIRRFRPDFIYERYALYNAAGVVAGRLSGTPVVEEVNAPLALERARYGGLAFPGLARWFERTVCGAATRVVAVSGVLRRILVDEGVPAERIVVIPNGVRPEALDEPTANPQARERLGIAQDALVLGFVGWFRSWHALDRLVEVFHERDLASRGCCLLLVGGGPAYRDVEERARALGLLDRAVFLTGPVPRDHVHGWIRAFDVALQPNVTEYASPMKIFEYLSLAKPVVAPDQDNIREILTDGVDSWVFRAGDLDAMGAVLQEISQDPEEARRRGAGARETIRKRGYLWERNVERTLHALAEATGMG